MSVEVQASSLTARDEWIAARVAEFEADPAARDRALATILFDLLLASENLQKMAEMVKSQGIGGIMKAILSGR